MEITVHAWRQTILSDAWPNISPLARLVALALAQHMNARTLETFVGAERVAMDTGLSERAVRSKLRELVTSGCIVEETASRGRAHWRKVRRANLPDSTEVPARGAATHEVPAPRAGSQAKLMGVAANHVTSGGKSVHRVAAPRAGDLVNLSSNDLDAGPAPPGAGAHATFARGDRERARTLRSAGVLIPSIAAKLRITDADVRQMLEDSL